MSRCSPRQDGVARRVAVWRAGLRKQEALTPTALELALGARHWTTSSGHVTSGTRVAAPNCHQSVCAQSAGRDSRGAKRLSRIRERLGAQDQPVSHRQPDRALDLVCSVVGLPPTGHAPDEHHHFIAGLPNLLDEVHAHQLSVESLGGELPRALVTAQNTSRRVYLKVWVLELKPSLHLALVQQVCRTPDR